MFAQDVKDFPIFQDVHPAQLDRLGTVFELIHLPRGTVIFDQGELAHFLYLLASGKVIIRFKPYDGSALTIAVIQPGDIFGWSAALGKAIYTSAAVAAEDCAIYRVRSDRFAALCSDCPQPGADLLIRLAAAVNDRLQSIQKEIVNEIQARIEQQDNGRRKGTHGR